MISQIRLLYPESFSPFSFTKNNRARGLVIDRLTRALDYMAVRPEFIPCEHEELIEGLKERRGDLAACLAVTAERKANLVFSRTILHTGGALFCLVERESATFPGELAAGTIATPSSGPLIEVIRNKWPEISLLAVAGYIEALDAVADGSADAAALNLHAGWEAAVVSFPGRFHQPTDVFVSLDLASAGLPGIAEPFIDLIDKGIRNCET